MKQYTIRRLLIMIPILLGVSIIVFLLISSIPGDAIDAMLGQSKSSPQRLAEIKALYGFDQPVWKRYLAWLGNALHGLFLPVQSARVGGYPRLHLEFLPAGDDFVCR